MKVDTPEVPLFFKVESISNRGRPAEGFARDLADMLFIISPNAEPKRMAEGIKARERVYLNILINIKKAIEADRVTVRNLLEKNGHLGAADLMRRKQGGF